MPVLEFLQHVATNISQGDPEQLTYEFSVHDDKHYQEIPRAIPSHTKESHEATAGRYYEYKQALT